MVYALTDKAGLHYVLPDSRFLPIEHFESLWRVAFFLVIEGAEHSVDMHRARGIHLRVQPLAFSAIHCSAQLFHIDFSRRSPSVSE